MSIPTLAQLHEDHAQAYKNDELNTLLAAPPPEAWLKRHPIYNNKYLPIDKVEFLLTRIFQNWYPEIIRFEVELNSVIVHARLHIMWPSANGGGWRTYDGIAAHPIQVDAGSKASDLEAIKNNGLMLAAPIAYSQAKKDAADQIGTLFGKDLNRKDTVEFQGYFTTLGQKPPDVQIQKPAWQISHEQQNAALVAEKQQQKQNFTTFNANDL